MKQRKNEVCVYVLFEFSILLDGRLTVANYHFDFRFRAVRAHANIVVTVTDTIHRSEVSALVRRHADNLDFSSSLHASSLLFRLPRLIYSSIVKNRKKRKKTVENLKPVTRWVRFSSQSLFRNVIIDYCRRHARTSVSTFHPETMLLK